MGARVSVVIQGHVHLGQVTQTSASSDGFIEVEVSKSEWSGAGHFPLHEEGITWCEGWRGRVVGALRVAAALGEKPLV